MKLFEITTRGPGDYWPGDELNPRSPDYDPEAASKRYRPQSRGPSQFPMSDREKEDIAWERRAAAASKASKQFETKGHLSSGEYKGKPYNLVMTIIGPTKAINWKVNGFLDFERNIYHDFAGVEYEQLDDTTSRAKIYIQAKDQSLLLQSVKRRAGR